jgi:hypothetical protein
MLSLDLFKYDAYNSDFGPLTINDLVVLTKTLNKRQNECTELHVGSGAKVQARGMCILACYLMYGRSFTVQRVCQVLGESTL